MSDWVAATIILLDGDKITLTSEDETSDALILLAEAHAQAMREAREASGHNNKSGK